MKIRGKLVNGIFIRRLNRYAALVALDKKEIRCFLPNPGRMQELLIAGAKVVLRKMEGPGRKTLYDLIATYDGGIPVSIDSRVPNRLIFESLRKGDLEEFSQYKLIRPEYTYGKSRFDFLLKDGSERLLEVKSCTLVKDGVALFPDAPTSRGRRHLMELAEARKKGYRACVLFLIQRTDAERFSPNDETDSMFGNALRQAFKEGVEVYAYMAEFYGREIVMKGKLRVDLDKKQLSKLGTEVACN